MDDIIRPRRPQAPTDPVVDAAGVIPRQPVPVAAAVHVPEPTAPAPQPVAPQTPVPTPTVVAAPVQPETVLNLPATEPDGSVNNLNTMLQTDGLGQSRVGEPIGNSNLDQDGAPAPAPVSTSNPSLLAEIEAQEARESDAKVSQAPKSTRGSKSHWPAIIIAVIMALGLIAGAGYAYWQNKKTKSEPVTQTTQQQEVAKNPASTTDIDKASADIDAAIKKIDETKEFQESDLTDATLGL